MAFPTLLNLAGSVVIFLLAIPFIYLISRFLKLHPKAIVISDLRKQTTLVFAVVLAVFIVAAIWRIFIYKVYIPTFQLGIHILTGQLSGQTIDFYDLFAFFLVYSILLLIVGVAMRRTNQKLDSIGFRKNGLGKSAILGVSMGAILTVIYSVVVSSLGMRFVGLSSILLFGLVFFIMVGFSEETVFRGFIQTRLVARFGKLPGLVIASFLFALYHYPLLYFLSSGDILGSLSGALLRIFPGLIVGYLMIRSQNLVAPIIFHTIYDYLIFVWH